MHRRRAVPEAVDLHPHALQQRQVQVGQIGRLREVERPPALDGAPAAAREQRGQVVRIVLVAVTEDRPVDDHAVVEQRPAVRLLDRLEAAEQVGHLPVVPADHLRVHPLFLLGGAPGRDAVVVLGLAGRVLVVRQPCHVPCTPGMKLK